MEVKVKIDDNLIKTIVIKEKESLKTALQGAGLYFPAPCGGKGVCGKCKVKLISSDYDEKTDKDGNILACKCFPSGNLSIELPLRRDVDIELIEKLESGVVNLAFDLGTTTLRFAVFDNSGNILARARTLNPQMIAGSDVLTRIEFCKNQDTITLRSILFDVLENVISKLKKVCNFASVDKLFVCGNTTMLHIFAGENPKSLGEYPFEPVFLSSKTFSGGEIGLSANNVYLLPCISAYVGSDAVSGVGCVGLGKGEKNELFIDVGTNTEIVLYSGGKFYCTSTSAGPAFEGGKIECGVGGVDGAINKVYSIPAFWGYETVGDAPPKGICGAGLVDFIACALTDGVIDKTGLIEKSGKGVKDGKIFLTTDVYISQFDVREIQLAKSAVRSGIEVLLSYVGVKHTDIEKVYVSGGMGSNFDIDSICKIGLIPKCFRDICEKVDDTALSGLLCSNDCDLIQKLNGIVDRSESIELSLRDDFKNLFIKNLDF